MDLIPGLTPELPMGLKDELTKRLVPTETVAVSLPGSFGEALVITDRRAIVLRDKAVGLDAVCDVYEYLLAGVTGAQAVSSSTGGYVELQLAKPAAEPDAARVYFPSYDLSKFQAAAEYLTKLVGEKPAPVAAAASGGAAASPADAVCPECGTRISAGAAFCRGCGQQLLAVCMNCSGGVLAGSEYCDHCGMKMVEFDPICRKCGGHVQRWMGFCPECGSIQVQKCAACGMPIVPGWKYCASCGRLFGSTDVDHQQAQRMQRRLQDVRGSILGTEPAEEPTPMQSAPATPAANSAAELHNQRGQEFFEREETEHAMSEFEQAVALDPGNPTYHCNLAVAYDECDRDEDALREYEKTLELAPNDLTALLSLGYMYNENDEPDKAQEVWHRVLQISPDSAEAQEVKENLRTQGQL